MAGAFDLIVQQIRERTDIVALISRFVPLQRKGSSYKACCPFHQEKTPSFHVHPDRQFFYCFGCGAKGDVFNFLMDYEGRRFYDIVRDLADELGLELPISSQEREEINLQEEHKEKLYQITQLACRFFQQNLKNNSDNTGLQYLQNRGIDEHQIEKFSIGYAIDAWGELTRHFREIGVDLELADQAGLIKTAENSDRYYDRFRHRVIFPITLPSGRLAGFGGRVLRNDDGAKYLNSPESPIFQKSDLLYGLDLAHHAIRKSRRALLTEGYLDVICMHQYGFTEAVATLGTALTEGHLRQLRRYAEELVLIFDADQAGFKAVERALPLLLASGISSKVLSLPEGEDPDSYLQKNGREAFEKLLAEETKPTFDFWLKRALKDANRDPIKLRDASHRALEHIRQISDPILQGLYLRQISEQLGVEEAPLRRQLMHVVPKHRSVRLVTGTAFSDREAKPEIPASREQEIMITLLKSLVENPELLSFVSQFEVSQKLSEKVWVNIWNRTLLDIQEDAESPILIRGVLEELDDYPPLQKRFAEFLLKSPPFELDTLQDTIEDCLEHLEVLGIERQLKEIQQVIRDAHQDGGVLENDFILEQAQLRFELSRKKAEIFSKAPRFTAIKGLVGEPVET